MNTRALLTIAALATVAASQAAVTITQYSAPTQSGGFGSGTPTTSYVGNTAGFGVAGTGIVAGLATGSIRWYFDAETTTPGTYLGSITFTTSLGANPNAGSLWKYNYQIDQFGTAPGGGTQIFEGTPVDVGYAAITGTAGNNTATFTINLTGLHQTKLRFTLGESFKKVDFDSTSVVVTPVPEPASMAALGLGVAAMLRRRRKA